MAFLDLEKNTEGFFAVMLQSIYAEPMVADARLEWEKLLVLPGGSVNTVNSMTTIHAASIAYTDACKQKEAAVKLSLFDADVRRWEIQNKFLDATEKNPSILTAPPAENGQTEFEDSIKSSYRDRNCDDDCSDNHSFSCHEDFSAALKEHTEYMQASKEAVVPDQEEPSSNHTFTFKRSRLISLEAVTKVFNYKNVIELFTEEEALTFYKRIR